MFTISFITVLLRILWRPYLPPPDAICQVEDSTNYTCECTLPGRDENCSVSGIFVAAFELIAPGPTMLCNYELYGQGWSRRCCTSFKLNAVPLQPSLAVGMMGPTTPKWHFEWWDMIPLPSAIGIWDDWISYSLPNSSTLPPHLHLWWWDEVLWHIFANEIQGKTVMKWCVV